MEAIVLAGGFGTRLRHLVSEVPKPMAQVAGRPFLEFVLDELSAQGIEKVVLAVGYKREIIEAYFSTTYKGMAISYSVEDQPLQTGGAIKKALCQCNQSNVFVVNGDTFFEVDFHKMQQQHKDSAADITVAQKKMYDFERYGSIESCGGRIIKFHEKRKMSQGYINGGIYLLRKNILESGKYGSLFSFENEVLEKELNCLKICSFNSDGYFIDIGIPEDYQKAQQDFSKSKLKG